ncbi:MAG: DUF2384 domain-containing protein [Alphaproteobacteria bacterium]|nr:DUF2384 domain-containing protein [Alphaproteobacteria bacterium]
MTRAPKKAKRSVVRRTASKRGAAKKSAVKRAKAPRAAPSKKSAAPSVAGARPRPASTRASAARAIAAIDALARACFGNSAAARSWLDAPKRRLDGAAPAELLVTAKGRREVRAWLEEIADGGVA